MGVTEEVRACRSHQQRETKLADKKEELKFLDALIAEEYPQLKYKIGTVWTLAKRGPEFVRMLTKLAFAMNSDGTKKGDNYKLYVKNEPGAEAQITQDLAMLTTYCAAAGCVGDLKQYSAEGATKPANYVLST